MGAAKEPRPQRAFNVRSPLGLAHTPGARRAGAGDAASTCAIPYHAVWYVQWRERLAMIGAERASCCSAMKARRR